MESVHNKPSSGKMRRNRHQRTEGNLLLGKVDVIGNLLRHLDVRILKHIRPILSHRYSAYYVHRKLVEVIANVDFLVCDIVEEFHHFESRVLDSFMNLNRQGQFITVIKFVKILRLAYKK